MAPPARTDVHQHLWALEVERLAPEDATPLLRAWGRVASELPAPLGAWASLNLASATPDDLDALLDEGFVGLCHGAQAIAAVAAVVGAGQLVHGSDFPVLAADAPADDARVRENPARLLG
jgi:hypothetical protein